MVNGLYLIKLGDSQKILQGMFQFDFNKLILPRVIFWHNFRSQLMVLRNVQNMKTGSQRNVFMTHIGGATKP